MNVPVIKQISCFLVSDIFSYLSYTLMHSLQQLVLLPINYSQLYGKPLLIGLKVVPVAASSNRKLLCIQIRGENWSTKHLIYSAMMVI